MKQWQERYFVVDEEDIEHHLLSALITSLSSARLPQMKLRHEQTRMGEDSWENALLWDSPPRLFGSWEQGLEAT